MEHKLHLLVARQASKAQSAKRKAQRNLVNNKITTRLLMLTILFSSNYLYSQGNNWKLDGNSNSGNASFLGTTNSFPLQFRTNNQNRFTIGSTGNYTFHTLSGNSNSLMLLNNNGEAYRLNFSQNNNDVLTGNGTWQSINTLVPQYWQLTNVGLYTTQAVVVNNTITATGMHILHRIEADTIKGVKKVDVNGNIMIGEDGTYKGITAKEEDLNINSKPGFDFNTILNANTNGNVGIGTSNPTKKLDVNGDARISGTLWANTLEGNIVSTQQLITNQLQINDSIKVGLNSIWLGGADQHTGNNNSIYTTQGALLIQNQSNSDNTIINPYSGKVGIGTYQPQAKLQINEIRVDNLFSPNPQFYTCEPLARFTHYFQKNDPLGCENINVLLVDHKEHNGGIQPLFAVNNNGYVGIGTNSPERNLHIKGNTPCVGTNCPVANPNDPLPATTYLRIEDNITDINGNSVATNKWDLAVSGNQNRFFIQRVNANAEALTILNNNNIGVGTTNPAQKFHVNGKAVFEDNVGIGVTNPSASLEIRKNALTEIKANAQGSNISRVWAMNDLYAYALGVDAQGRGHIYENANAPTSLMTFENGNIGIGTTSTGSFKLAVDGKVGAREFKVTQASPWPDYVFAPNYNLMPIEQVAAYIKVNKHLPGIPSAKEIEENQGFDIGATQIKLLEKVEEMMLYIIELKRENEALKQEINRVKK